MKMTGFPVLQLPLFALGFESLPMLGWLAAAAAPWLIHFLNRRKHRETAWAAMTFLLAAAKRRSGRIRFEQWLLLLLRTLIVVTLVTAVAQPYWQHALPIFAPSGSTHRVLVIDSSYSMAYKATDQTRFEQAKQWAARIVEKSPPGDGFTLVQMAAPPRVIVATPGLEAAVIEQEIQGLELVHSGADLAATLAEIQKLLDTARRDSPRLKRHEVYFFTDLQRGTWLPAMNETKKADLRGRAANLAAIAQLRVFDLGQPGDDNLAVTSLEIRDPMILVGRNVALEASVRDFGRVARQHQAVDLLIDESLAGRQYIDIPAGGSAVARFSPRFESAGDHAVEVRLAGDPRKPGDGRGPADALDIDNHRYLAVQVRQAIRVLCIDGRPAGDPRKSSVANLVVALSSHGDPQRPSPIRFDVATENAVLERPLGQYDCVMLCDVAQFTESEARALDNYLLRGGSLVFFLGERVIADNYNHILAGDARPVLPARLVAVTKNPGGRLDPLDYRHRIVKIFLKRENTKLLQSPIDRYFKVQLSAAGPDRSAARTAQPPRATESPAAEVALALSNGDPLIVTQTVRRGRVVLVTTSADTSWSLLPVLGNYEPLVKEILTWSIAGQTQRQNVDVGDPLESALPEIATPPSVWVERPGGQDRAVPSKSGPLEAQGVNSLWRYEDTFSSGIYTVHFGPPLSQNRLFAVNVMTAESDLVAISPDELENEVWPGVALGFETSRPGDGGPLPPAVSPSEQLHVALFWLVVVLLLSETTLSWRFGYNA
jgi:hypothetical protein